MNRRIIIPIWLAFTVFICKSLSSNEDTARFEKRATTNVRLVNGRSPSEGRLEVLHNGRWGTVCDDGFSDKAASVVCRMLSLGNLGHQFQSATFGQGKLPILLDDVACTGKEHDISECSHSAWGTNNCYHTEDVSVKCFNAVRLVGGLGPWEGMVEYFYKDKWRTVCSNGFENHVAKIVCKSLNYSSSSATVMPYGSYGQGVGQISQVSCTGYEKNFASCNYTFSSANCSHADGVSVKCGCKQ